MNKAMKLLQARFGISKEEAMDLESKGLYGVFVSPTYDNSEPEDEIHLQHQLYENFNCKDEKLIATAIEKVKYKVENGIFKVTSTEFTH